VRPNAGIAGAIRLRARHHLELAITETTDMKKLRENMESEEPIGIIISRGDRTEVRPIFSAYIWGPAPEPATADAKAKVA